MKLIRKLSNFNFQRTKTLYQNNLTCIAFFFTFSQLVIFNNTKENFSREPGKINVKYSQNDILKMKFLQLFYLCFHNSCEIWHSLVLQNVKKNAIFFKLFWYKVFVHWKLKLFNFLMDFVLRWVETATAMRKISKTIVEYKQEMASSSISETMDFDIQGRDVHTPY